MLVVDNSELALNTRCYRLLLLFSMVGEWKYMSVHKKASQKYSKWLKQHYQQQKLKI